MHTTASSFVLQPPLPTLPAHRRRILICATAGGGAPTPAPDDSLASDQFQQYEARNRAALAHEFNLAQALPTRQRHHHFFLQTQADTPFRKAAERFITALRSSDNPIKSRLWILRSSADPTFGRLRGEPYPPRAIIVEPQSDRSEVLRWISALGRAGRALSHIESHFVDWGVVAAFGADFTLLREDEVVASEILNADWTRAQSVRRMKEKLVAHAKDVVERGNARIFEVFQSCDEPTCFKTLEVYPSLDSLQEHMLTLDPPFAKNMMECRAAVNRVRQLNTPVFSLQE